MNGVEYLVGEIERLRSELTELRAQYDGTGLNNPWGLSRRQIQVLRLIAQGYSYIEIGDKIGIGWQTVHKHALATFKKIGVRDRLNAARWAWKHGIICPDEAWETVQRVQWGTLTKRK